MINFLFFILCFLALPACKPLPNDGIPVYLSVDSARLETTPSQGASTHRISDLWVEAGPENLGVYEMPCRFPVLREGMVNLVLNPGILKDGQNNQRIVYPFYTPYLTTVEMRRGEALKLNPVFRYKDGINFPLNESFETGNAFVGLDRSSADSLVISGSSSGVMFLSESDSLKEAVLGTVLSLPAGSQIFLEMDYKSNVFFTVGVLGVTGTFVNRFPKIIVAPKSSPNKIYIEISNEVGLLATPKYNLYLQVQKPAGSTAWVSLDNVRILHF